MGLSVIRNDPHDIIALRKVKTLLGINQMGLSAPRAYSPEIISLQTVISLFFLLTWPLCIAIIINIGRWGYLTKAEASVALDTDPFGFHATLHTIHHTSVRSSLVLLSYHSPPFILTYPTLSLPPIIPSPSPPPPLLPHAPPLSPGYPGWDAPAIAWVGAVPDSAPLPNTSP